MCLFVCFVCVYLVAVELRDDGVVQGEHTSAVDADQGAGQPRTHRPRRVAHQQQRVRVQELQTRHLTEDREDEGSQRPNKR